MKWYSWCFFLSVVAVGPLRAAAPPHILFIAVDDLRPEFGAYGANYIKSPNLDRLARSGMTFKRAYCQQAVCSPSRTSLLTGVRPDTSKVWDLQTHFRTALPGVITLGQHFKSHGYFVQGMGKIFHGGFDDAPSWSVPWQASKGAAYGLLENQNASDVAPAGEGKPGARLPKAKRAQASGPRSRGPAFEAADVPDETFTDGKVASLAVQALGERSQHPEPFFLAVGFSKPHLPFVAPKKYWDLYDPATIKLAPNPFRAADAPDYAVLEGGELRNYRGIPDGSLSEDLARQLKHGYYAAISYMDAQLGRVLDELDRLGLSSRTIVVLWGDHGWKLGEHDAWCKHSNTENDTHAPLLLSVPGMKHVGGASDGLVEFVDIYPTLVDLAGLPQPAHLEGTSFRPLLEHPERAWKTAAFSQYPRGLDDGRKLMGYSMVTARYRFTAWVPRREPNRIEALELYDHEVDPQENVNVAARPEMAGLVEQLSAQWRAGWKGARPAAAGK